MNVWALFVGGAKLIKPARRKPQKEQARSRFSHQNIWIHHLLLLHLAQPD
jgi:hypothetical protein